MISQDEAESGWRINWLPRGLKGAIYQGFQPVLHVSVAKFARVKIVHCHCHHVWQRCPGTKCGRACHQTALEGFFGLCMRLHTAYVLWTGRSGPDIATPRVRDRLRSCAARCDETDQGHQYRGSHRRRRQNRSETRRPSLIYQIASPSRASRQAGSGLGRAPVCAKPRRDLQQQF